MEIDDLDSAHLDSSRRKKFRRVRMQTFLACGPETLLASKDEKPLETHPLPFFDQREDSIAYVLVKLADGEVSPLQVGINVIGRLSTNTVPLADEYVSRRHCVIIVHAGGKCEVQDLSSRNGTRVNGRAVTVCTRLSAGDIITVGRTKLVILPKENETEPFPPDDTLRLEDKIE